MLRNGVHHSPHLQHSFDLHGEGSFSIVIVEMCDEGQLVNREQYWIDSTEHLYNARLDVVKGGQPKRNHPVFSKRGGETTYFSSIDDAIDATGVSRLRILKCLCGAQATSNGYQWSLSEVFTARVRKRKTKPVFQYGKLGQFIKEFESIDAAAGSIGDTKGKINSTMVRGRKGKASLPVGGFYWSRSKVDNLTIPASRKSKPVIAQGGKFSRLYASAREAAIDFSISYRGISDACNRRIKSSGGVVWRFADGS